MPLIRFPTVKGLVFTVDLSKLADRELPSGSTQTLEEYRRTVEAPVNGYYSEDIVIDWGDGSSNSYSMVGSTVTSGNGTKYPAHTYADGTGNIFTVVIRSVSGGLPIIHFNDTAFASTPARNLTYAVVSIDHFGGTCARGVNTSRNNVAKKCTNLKYIDTRICGEAGTSSMPYMCALSGIEQPLESFCFDFLSLASDCANVFNSCYYLTGSIPKRFFSGMVNLTSANAFLYDCRGLTGTLDAELFSKNTRVTTFSNMFNNCSGLTGSIPQNLFKYNTSVTTFANCFSGCSGLAGSIPADLFKYNTAVTVFTGCFASCTSLTGPIPSDLFDNNISITEVKSCFRYCSGLTAPYEFWNKSYAANITNSATCYDGCTGMDRSQIPSAYGGTGA